MVKRGTGDTLGQASENFLAQARRPLLEKPFLPSDVRRLIDELLGRGGPAGRGFSRPQRRRLLVT